MVKELEGFLEEEKTAFKYKIASVKQMKAMLFAFAASKSQKNTIINMQKMAAFA